MRRALPWARTFMVFARRLNRHAIRSPLYSISSAEFVAGAHDVKAIIHRTVRDLETRGIRAVGVGSFPMEFGRPDGSPFVLQLKYLAEAAGLGVMGKNRMVLHPHFGADVYLGAIVLDCTIEPCDQPLGSSPCVDCNLCAATCPTGAIATDGHFDFSGCSTHNYREKTNGFVEWVHTLADSRGRRDYRRRVNDDETLSWWQSLGYEANTHCSYCVAVCPAGDEAVAFLEDRKAHVREVVRPLRDRVEKIYVVPGSDAEAHLAEAFPHKSARLIGSGRLPDSIATMIRMLPVVFQRGRSQGVAARYHFRFRGSETAEATVDIRDGRITVEPGHVGRADLTVTADSDAWLGVLAKDRSMAWEMLRGRIRTKGPRRLLADFGRCFRS
jgi:Fe-S-cluster-containing hydrogenase component 2